MPRIPNTGVPGLNVPFGLDPKNFSRGLAQARKDLNQFKLQVQSVKRDVAKGFGDMGKSAQRSVKDIVKSSIMMAQRWADATRRMQNSFSLAMGLVTTRVGKTGVAMERLQSKMRSGFSSMGKSISGSMGAVNSRIRSLSKSMLQTSKTGIGGMVTKAIAFERGIDKGIGKLKLMAGIARKDPAAAAFLGIQSVGRRAGRLLERFTGPRRLNLPFGDIGTGLRSIQVNSTMRQLHRRIQGGSSTREQQRNDVGLLRQEVGSQQGFFRQQAESRAGANEAATRKFDAARAAAPLGRLKAVAQSARESIVRLGIVGPTVMDKLRRGSDRVFDGFRKIGPAVKRTGSSIVIAMKKGAVATFTMRNATRQLKRAIINTRVTLAVFGNASVFMTKKAIAGFTGFFRVVGRGIGKMVRGFRLLRTNFLAILLVGGLLAAPVVALERMNRAMAKGTVTFKGLSTIMRVDMKNAAIDLSRTLLFSATQIAEGYADLGRAGFDALSAMQVMPTVARFAQAGMIEVSQAATILSRSMKSMGLFTDDAAQNMKNMERIANALAVADVHSTSTVTELGTALVRSAGAFRANNIEIEEGIALLAAFADKSGRVGPAGGRAARIVLKDLQEAFRKHPGTFTFELGANPIFDRGGGLNNMVKILGLIERKVENLSVQGKVDLFARLGLPKRSSNFLKEVLGSSEDQGILQTLLADTGNAIKRLAESQMTPLQTSIQNLKASFLQWADSMDPVIDQLIALSNITAAFFDSGAGLASGEGFSSFLVGSIKLFGDGVQVFVQALLEAVVLLKKFIHGFRSSPFGAKFGVGFETVDDPNAPDFLQLGNPFSLINGKAFLNLFTGGGKIPGGRAAEESLAGIKRAEENAAGFKKTKRFSDVANDTIERGRALGTVRKFVEEVKGFGFPTLGTTPENQQGLGAIGAKLFKGFFAEAEKNRSIGDAITIAANAVHDAFANPQNTATEAATRAASFIPDAKRGFGEGLSGLSDSLPSFITGKTDPQPGFLGGLIMQAVSAVIPSIVGRVADGAGGFQTPKDKAVVRQVSLAQVGTIEGYRQRIQATQGGQSIEQRQLTALERLRDLAEEDKGNNVVVDVG